MIPLHSPTVPPYTRHPVSPRVTPCHPSLPPRSTSVATGSWARTCGRTGAGSAGVTGAAACPWRDSSTALFLKEVGRQNCPDFIYVGCGGGNSGVRLQSSEAALILPRPSGPSRSEQLLEMFCFLNEASHLISGSAQPSR